MRERAFPWFVVVAAGCALPGVGGCRCARSHRSSATLASASTNASSSGSSGSAMPTSAPFSDVVLDAPPNGDAPNAIAWSPDGAHIADAFARTIRIWNVASGVVESKLESEPKSEWSERPTAIAYMTDGQHLVVGHADGAVGIVDLATLKVLWRDAPSRPYGVASVEVSADGKHFLVLGSDPEGGSLRVYSSSTHALELRKDERFFRAGFLGSDRVVAANAHEGLTVLGVDPRTSVDFPRFEHVHDAAGSRDGRLLVACDARTDGKGIVLVDPGTGTVTKALAHEACWNPTFSSLGTLLVECPGAFVVWDPASGARMGTLSVIQPRPRVQAWSPDGARVAFVAHDRKTHVVSAPTRVMDSP